MATSQLAAAICVVGAQAGSLRVGPTLIELDQAAPVAVVRVTNNNAVRTAVDARVNAWQQVDNEDQYTETSQIIVRPAVFELDPGESQVVRVGLPPITVNTPASELPYRVFISELPQTGKSSEETQLLMRVGIPVFVYGKQLSYKLQWKIDRAGDQHYRLNVTNVGLARARFLDIAVRTGSTVVADLGASYLLPGASHSWPISFAGGLEAFNLTVKVHDRAKPIYYGLVANALQTVPVPDASP